MFEGLIVALPTPFDNKNQIARTQLKEHIEWLISQGVDGIVPCGTTGEFATLTSAEREEVMKIAIDTAHGRIGVIAGTGSYSTQATVELTARAKELGADGAMVVTPYYNKPNQEGLRKHYEAVAEVGFPVCLYNVPGRTGTNLLPETVEQLAAHDQIVAIKEASGNLVQGAEIIRRTGEKLTFLAGDDALYYPLLCLGAKGVVSVAGNIAAKPLRELSRLTAAGELAKARALHLSLLPLFEALFCETSPTPVKYALSQMKRMYATVRLPLVPLTAASGKRIEGVLKQFHLTAEREESLESAGRTVKNEGRKRAR